MCVWPYLYCISTAPQLHLITCGGSSRHVGSRSRRRRYMCAHSMAIDGAVSDGSNLTWHNLTFISHGTNLHMARSYMARSYMAHSYMAPILHGAILHGTLSDGGANIWHPPPVAQSPSSPRFLRCCDLTPQLVDDDRGSRSHQHIRAAGGAAGLAQLLEAALGGLATQCYRRGRPSEALHKAVAICLK